MAGNGTVSRPPLRLLMQVSMPAGERRQKKPEKVWLEPRAMYERNKGYTRIDPWEPPRNQSEYYAQLREKRMMDQRIVNPNYSPVAKMELGNLLFDDYRFWIGGQLAVSVFAMCRACRQMPFGIEARREHFERYKCSLWMVEAIKILAAERVCAVCEKKHCKDMTWGIPVCESPCRERWMFTAGTPWPLWQVALAESKDKVMERMLAAQKEWREKKGTV